MSRNNHVERFLGLLHAIMSRLGVSILSKRRCSFTERSQVHLVDHAAHEGFSTLRSRTFALGHYALCSCQETSRRGKISVNLSRPLARGRLGDLASRFGRRIKANAFPSQEIFSFSEL